MIPKVVIGAGYGDEGKGLITDYLCSRYGADLVVRFNGGAQAGHTVQTPSGERHVFSHISSGTFTGASTFLSKHFIVNPMIFFKEIEGSIRNSLRTIPDVYVDPGAIVTTPYDMLVNQLLEDSRASKHGSCGLGINETVVRSEASADDPSLLINFEMLGDRDRLKSGLQEIRDKWFPLRCARLGLDPSLGNVLTKNSNVFNNFMDDAAAMYDRCMISDSRMLHDAHQVVFEGAQGLLLDEIYGKFPHVTRSRTGMINVAEICSEAVIEEVDVTYVTRCYLTRHGAGPLANELGRVPYQNVEDPTNIPNKYQGELRFAYLDVDQLKSVINQDLMHTRGYLEVRKHQDSTSTDPQYDPQVLQMNINLAVTCLDQVDNEIKVYHGGSLQTLRGDQYGDVGDMIGSLVDLDGPLIKSFGPTRSTITQRE